MSLLWAKFESFLYRIGVSVAVHNHEEGFRGDRFCAGCLEEEVRLRPRKPRH